VKRGGAVCTESRLANGLRVLVAERHTDPIVTTVLCYGAGARTEREDEAGVSHFLEHMMFKGSRKYAKGAIDLETARLGGSNNAFTGHDHTAYWFELASDRWETALAIEADRMRHVALAGHEFDAEREVVLEELAQGEDDPWMVLMRRVEAALFPRHPYGRPIIGYVDTLRRATPDSLRDYHRRNYHPANALLVVAGDVERATALQACEKHFGRIPGRPASAQALPHRAPLTPIGARARIVQTWPDPARRLCFAFPTCAVGTREDLALDLATMVLGSGRLSRLQKRLVYDERLATRVSLSNDTRVDGGVYWISAEASLGVELARLEHAIEEELARLRNELVSASELRRALALLRSGEAFESESISGLAQELATAGIDDDWRGVLDDAERHAAIRAHEIRAVVSKYLTPERAVVGESVPGALSSAAR
jgi:zinc protease